MPIYRFIESGNYSRFCEAEASDVKAAFKLLDDGLVEEVDGSLEYRNSKVTLHEIKFHKGEYERMQEMTKTISNLLSEHRNFFATVKAWDYGDSAEYPRYTVFIGEDVWFLPQEDTWKCDGVWGAWKYDGKWGHDYLGELIPLDKLSIKMLKQIITLGEKGA